MRRGIGPQERSQRSRKLVELALEGVRGCAGATPQQPLAELMEKARKRNADVEANLDLAERLWQARRSECGPATSPADQAMPLRRKFSPSLMVVGYLPVGATKNIVASVVQNPMVPVLNLTVPSGRFSTSFSPMVAWTVRSRL